MAATTEVALLAGGCFWGVQGLLRRYPGILKTRGGYTGGEVADATYRNHRSLTRADQLPPIAGVLLPDPCPEQAQPLPNGYTCHFIRSD